MMGIYFLIMFSFYPVRFFLSNFKPHKSEKIFSIGYSFIFGPKRAKNKRVTMESLTAKTAAAGGLIAPG